MSLEQKTATTVQDADKAEAKEYESTMIPDVATTNAPISVEEFAHLDEKKILRKMDLRLIPMLTLLYLLSYLDRGNIGNAKVEGLVDDLHMSGDQYNWCLTVFFFTYAAFEVPSNLVLKKLRPSRWLPTIMIAWGVVMTLMGLVKNYHGLLICRIFLGVTEAGLYPGVTYYLTMWYCRHEMQIRQALFFSAASIAGAFSGLLAFGIAKLDGTAGLEGWRWIFILEGIATVAVAISAFFALYDFPETAGFLNEEEKNFVLFRLQHQGGMRDADGENVGATVQEAGEFKWAYVRQAFTDWQVWTSIIVYWGFVCPIFGISLSLPSIIADMGYGRSTAQLMTIPIYVAASIIALIVAYSSDRAGLRSPFFLGCMMLVVVGLAMCLISKDSKVVYAGLIVAACGMYPASPSAVTWLSNNLSGTYKRSTGMALQMSIGNLGGAMASNFYRARDAPRYIMGHGLSMGFAVAGILAAGVLVMGYTLSNRKRQQAVRNGERANFTEDELAFKGDKAITWRYMM